MAVNPKARSDVVVLGKLHYPGQRMVICKNSTSLIATGSGKQYENTCSTCQGKGKELSDTKKPILNPYNDSRAYNI
jgi:predicted methyltransferase